MIDRDQTGLVALLRGEAGHEWAEKQYLIPIQQDWVKDTLDILGESFSGLYNAPITHKSWKEFFNDLKSGKPFHVVRFIIGGTISTCDFNDMTKLVVLCHDRAIRLEISAHCRSHFQYTFTERKRGNNPWECHPALEAGIEYARYFRRGQDLRTRGQNA